MLNTDHTTVSSAYFEMKRFLISVVGLTVASNLSTFDCVFVGGDGKFLRLKKESPSAGVEAIGLAFGTDLNELVAGSVDCESVFPFLTEGGLMILGMEWVPDRSFLQIAFIGDFPKRYRVEIFLAEQKMLLVHQNHLAQEKEPNFHLTGGEYMKCGA